jgi:hypothetical protein
VYALLAVGAATEFRAQSHWLRVAAGVLCIWLAVAALWVHPFYIEYFNELVGGPGQGHRYLLDSNLDWGQDVKRLRRYLDERGLQHIYLQYEGVPGAIDYYKIQCTGVTAEQAREIRSGVLVISVTSLMRPEWKWLREQSRPMQRVGYTLFVYKLG